MEPERVDTALRDLLDAVCVWRLVREVGMSEVIDAATTCLVAGHDTPSLRILAGTSVGESAFVVEPLIVATIEELGLADAMGKDQERSAMEAMVRRFLAGTLQSRTLGRWAHKHIGHQGPLACQPFVNLDDHFDDCDAGGVDETTLEKEARAEAVAFLAGEPSPHLL